MGETLRSRVRAGDPAAFARLFDEHARAVFRHAARLTDHATAEDITQLTFLEAWRIRDRVHADGESLLPWLLGIATNVQRNVSRAARRHQAALARTRPPDPVPDFADDVAGRMDDAERVAAAQRALAKLRRGEREVFTLCVWSGLDYAAAAEALGVPVGTVRSRLSRARARLQKLADAEMQNLRVAAEPATAAGQERGGRPMASRSPQGSNR
ncbi:RNA polymerase sigma factor [Saccharopolyspora shandongensis]|uniref:RNA polymerase sigma factor n=1 Tax=Saccharopolyspora shandongensis TaxID=418495 RepID=UPI00342EFABB